MDPYLQDVVDVCYFLQNFPVSVTVLIDIGFNSR